MKELLTARGWPDNMSNDQIIQHLPDLWKKLEAEGHLATLVARGFNYSQFVQLALNSRAKADAMEHMAQFFRRR